MKGTNRNIVDIDTIEFDFAALVLFSQFLEARRNHSTGTTPDLVATQVLEDGTSRDVVCPGVAGKETVLTK